MHRKTKVCTGLIVAFGGSLAIGSLPAHAQQSLERVEITGSAIKRVQAEGPAPVEIYTRRDIERTGATTITELVKNISSLDIDDQGELTGNSPSGSGTTNLQIRGLSERNLLILLNGRRLPVNALHDGSGAGAAVDVNNIPLSAIERVEILKDGGSAIYGADAVAGVINFITRKNFTGLEARIGYGISSRRDAKEVPAGIVFGYGDYDTQGFNVLGALDYFKRDAIPRSERDITRSADWRRFDNGNGVDGRSTFHPSGNIVAGPGAPGQLAPCPPEDLPLVGGLCRFDFSRTILESTNGADRWSGMAIGSVKLGNIGRGFLEVTYSESKDLFLAQPAPGAFVNSAGQTIRARFMQPGPRTTDRKSTLLHTVLGAEGSVGKLDWDIAIGQGTSKVTNQDSNYLATDLFVAAIDAGTIDPTSTNNPTAAIDALRLTPRREGKSVVKFANGKVGGQIMELGGGPLAYAVGLQAQRETLSDQPDAQQQAGNVFGSIAQGAVSAKRSSHAVFAELSIPAFKNFESQVAVRYDKYPDTSRTSPKFAVKYQPFSSFLVRGSYAGSFLAPSLKQLYGGQDQGAESVSNDANGNPHPVCAAFPTLSGTCDNFPYQQVSGSNPNLKPEIGKTYNLGFVFEPVPQASLGVDFWWIKKKDEINTLSVESAVANGDIGISPLGEAQVFLTNQNVAATKVNGVDLDARLRFADTPVGRITVSNKTTLYTKNDSQFEPNGPFLEYNGTFLYPKWRNTFNINFEKGPWSTTFNMRTTSSMKDTDQPKGELEYETARTIGSYTEVDGLVQYTGFKGLTLTGGVKNIFDRMPPYSNEGTQNQYGSLGFPWIYSPRGRFFFVQANYKFF
ncbi:MAG TPA: TonB-dependent receptor [Caldimonas sp.]|jgi:iron complex outermembrane receptor protein|nr:TonB-dependent receptor [Caldimonas sp.]HEX2541857.1 TonB-dependent receptor [Caldimonas sp.]